MIIIFWLRQFHFLCFVVLIMSPISLKKIQIVPAFWGWFISNSKVILSSEMNIWTFILIKSENAIISKLVPKNLFLHIYILICVSKSSSQRFSYVRLFLVMKFHNSFLKYSGESNLPNTRLFNVWKINCHPFY